MRKDMTQNFCELLGVKVGEPFVARGTGHYPEIFKIEPYAQLYSWSDLGGWHQLSGHVIREFITGQYSVVALPENIIHIKNYLKLIGDFRYLAVDKDGTVAAFTMKPKRCDGEEYWYCGGNMKNKRFTLKDLHITELTWEDDPYDLLYLRHDIEAVEKLATNERIFPKDKNDSIEEDKNVQFK